jgi:hypothetical protein
MSPGEICAVVPPYASCGGTMKCPWSGAVWRAGVGVGGGKRLIQTAVLGSAESEEPLLLPLEAIELDAFRRRHAADTFWCGLLLGGCGAQPGTGRARPRGSYLSSGK